MRSADSSGHAEVVPERGRQVLPSPAVPKTQDARGILSCLLHLIGIALARGDYEGALSLLQETLRLGLESDGTVSIQVSLHRLASVAASREQPVRAGRLWGLWKACRRLMACTSRPWLSP